MEKNICFYEEDDSLYICGFFEFLCNLGYRIEDNSFDEKTFFKNNKVAIYKELLAWSENSKNLINNLLLAAIFGKIDSHEFDARKAEIIEYVESAQKCVEYFNCFTYEIFEPEKQHYISSSFLECTRISLTLKTINYFYVVSSVPNRGFNNDCSRLIDIYNGFKIGFNAEIDKIYPSPLGEENISKLRELVSKLEVIHNEVMKVANVYYNYLFAKEKENVKEINGSLETLINMERSTNISEDDLNDVFSKMIRYSNYLDPNLKSVVQENLNESETLAVEVSKRDVFNISLLWMLLAAIISNDTRNIQVFASRITIPPILIYILGETLVSKINAIADKKYMISKTLENEIETASSIQNGRSWVNESIRSLKLLDK